jgi:hypothetical protein
MLNLPLLLTLLFHAFWYSLSFTSLLLNDLKTTLDLFLILLFLLIFASQLNWRLLWRFWIITLGLFILLRQFFIPGIRFPFFDSFSFDLFIPNLLWILRFSLFFVFLHHDLLFALLGCSRNRGSLIFRVLPHSLLLPFSSSHFNLKYMLLSVIDDNREQK